MKFSLDGAFFAFADGCRVHLVDVAACKIIYSFDLPKCSALSFSPKNSFLFSWQPYSTTAQQAPSPNTFAYDTTTAQLAASFIQKKQLDWEPQWSDDEKVCAKLQGSELQFHEDKNMERYSNKLVIKNLSTFSFSPGLPPYHVAVHVAGAKGSPDFVRLLSYSSNIQNAPPIANKSFFVADRVQMKWNSRGTALIFLASADVDKSGASYYGEQHIYLMLTNGESFKLPLDKAGPIYHFQWNPNSQEFCVVYGFMPAKAALFNLKGEAVFDFGQGSRNEAYYNPFGSLIALCGYGNLRGGMEFWSVPDRKLVHKLIAEDTTYFQWSKDGEGFITATTAPRLRVNNGYKIWDYTGAIKNKFLIPVDPKNQHELWEVCFCPPKPSELAALKAPAIRWREVSEQKKIESQNSTNTAAYVPPHMRGKQPAAAPKKLHEEEKKHDGKKIGSPRNKPTAVPAAVLSADQEMEKKAKTLRKKLDQIADLKRLQAEGKVLEVNQLEKISKEELLRSELAQLSI